MASQTIGTDVFSMRNGRASGKVSGILIDPDKFTVAAFWVLPSDQKQDSLLLMQDVREYSPRGIVVDDVSVFTDVKDLPKLRPILEIDYQIPGKKIIGKHRHYGTATDFGFESKNYQVASVVVKPSLTRRWAKSQHSFYRRQIAKIDDTSIHIKDDPVKTRQRKSHKKPAQIQTKAAYTSSLATKK